jgi:nucleotide-binding universal stress UspA family protein
MASQRLDVPKAHPHEEATHTPLMQPAALRSILFPSDLSPESDAAFEHARFLADRFGARVTLFNALEIPWSEYRRWATGPEDEVWERLAANARRELERRAKALNVPYEVVVREGVPAVPALVDLVLVDLIHRTQPDLTVMATHRRGAMGALFLGSVTEQVLRNSGRPVLCVRPGGRRTLPYRRILVPTDFSAHSRRAFPLAALLARRFLAEVITVHVAPWPTVASVEGVPYASHVEMPSDGALRAFLQPHFERLQLTPWVLRGSAWDRIVNLADEVKADLIVMSTRGQDSLGDRILGSQTERVIRHAGCPVLAV